MGQVPDGLDNQKIESLRRAIIEGCRDTADVYLEIELEYHPLEEEVQHALDPDDSSSLGV